MEETIIYTIAIFLFFLFVMRRRIRNYFSALLTASFIVKGVEFEDYLEYLKDESNMFTVFMGISSQKKGFYIQSLIKNPGLVVCGGQGSGKSFTGIFVLSSLLLSSSKELLIFACDSSNKRMGDYRFLFQYPNVIPAVGDMRKVILSINTAYAELQRRGVLFNEACDTDNFLTFRSKYPKYLKKTKSLLSRLRDISYSELKEKERVVIDKLLRFDLFNIKDSKFDNILRRYSSEKSLSRDDFDYLERVEPCDKVPFIILAFEEFHDIANSPQINLSDDIKTEGTVANELFKIARTGRSFGLNIFIFTQKASYQEVHSDLKSGVVNYLAHKVSDASAVSAIDLAEAMDIDPSINGRSVTKSGGGKADQIQFPFFPETKELYQFVEDYYEPLEAKPCGFNLEEIKASLESDDSDTIFKEYDLAKLLSNYKMMQDSGNRVTFMERVLVEFGFQNVEVNRDETLDMIDGVATRGGRTYALYIHLETEKYTRKFISSKKIDILADQISELKVDSLIVISFSDSIDSADSLVRKLKGYNLDKEDLDRIVKIISNKNSRSAADYHASLQKLPLFESSIDANISDAKKNGRILDLRDDDLFEGKFFDEPHGAEENDPEEEVDHENDLGLDVDFGDDVGFDLDDVTEIQ